MPSRDVILPAEIRRVIGAHAADSELVAQIVAVFRDARRSRLQFTLDLHDAAEDRVFLSTVVLPHSEVWVGEVHGGVVGFIAFSAGWVNHLYVAPSHQRRGLGRRLLDVAKSANLSLQLWAFEANAPAIAFYEREGFRIAERTDGSGNEARMPDVRMQWPAPASASPLPAPR